MGEDDIQYVFEMHVYFSVCDLFWTSPSLGTDSEFGDLVRETNHFTLVRGATNWASGRSNCLSLVTIETLKAVAIADSRKYFHD